MKRGCVVAIAALIMTGCAAGPAPRTEAVTTPTTEETPTQTVSPVSNTGIHPVLNRFLRLQGGLVEGEWGNDEAVHQRMSGAYTYRFYSQTALLGEAEVETLTTEHYLDGSAGYAAQLDSVPEGALFAVAGTWNALPRPVKEIPAERYGEYEAIIGDLLISTGMAGDPKVTRVLECDLEGDGKEEALILATNISAAELEGITEGKMPDPTGKYSMVAIRRAGVDGYTGEAVLATKDFLELQEIACAADLDGDGQLELLLDQENLEAVGAEGFSLSTWSIWDLEDGAWVRQTERFSNPI